jgi:hypothetical protein
MTEKKLTDLEYKTMLALAFEAVDVSYFTHADGDYRVLFSSRHLVVTQQQVQDRIKEEGGLLLAEMVESSYCGY